MSLVDRSSQEDGHGLTPRRAALVAGALGFATLVGMALGSTLPAMTKGLNFSSSPSALAAAAPSQAPAAPMTAEEKARDAAKRQLAEAMLKKSLTEQAASLKTAPATEPAPATTGANASAALSEKADATTAPNAAGAQVAAAPTPPATDETASLDPEDMQRLAGKAAEAIRNGDIASARLVLEHAVRAGDATALYALAETYDPRVLVKLKVQGMTGDGETARSLYQQALDKGVEEARARL